MRRTAWYGGALTVVALPLAVLFAPTTLAAQPTTRPAVVLEGYLSRARLDPSVGGSRTEVEGVGGRVLASLAPLPGERATGLARRLAVGGFATYAPGDEGGFAAWHYGAVADVRLLGRPLADRVDPLLSLGAGAFGTRRALEVARRPTPECVRPMDFVAGAPSVSCGAGAVRTEVTRDFALSPAAGLRIWMMPDLALRLDARDVVVYRGAPRHNLELATGVSFVR